MINNQTRKPSQRLLGTNLTQHLNQHWFLFFSLSLPKHMFCLATEALHSTFSSLFACEVVVNGFNLGCHLSQEKFLNLFSGLERTFRLPCLVVVGSHGNWRPCVFSVWLRVWVDKHQDRRDLRSEDGCGVRTWFRLRSPPSKTGMQKIICLSPQLTGQIACMVPLDSSWAKTERDCWE